MSAHKSLVAAALLTLVAGCATPQGDTGGGATTSGTAQASAAERGQPVRFFIIGDTGVIGDEGNLADTSRLVRESCGTPARCDFGLMSGDNIYPSGATGDPVKDAATFDTLFTRPFGGIWAADAPAQPRLFVALGNHDWYNGRAGAMAQVRFHETNRPFYMNGVFYSRRFEVRGTSIEVFVLDTEMLLAPHRLVDYDRAPDGSMVATADTDAGGTPNALPIDERERQQARWFAQALAASSADWKLVLTHHPIWQGRSDSKFAQSQKLRELILPALCRDADAFFAGHQHTIEIHTDSCAAHPGADAGAAPLPQVVSGAGAKARTIDPAFIAWQARQYPQARALFGLGDAAGYVEAEISGDRLTVTPVTAAKGGAPVRHESFSFTRRARR